jgi:thiol:disulfide interchange protein
MEIRAIAGFAIIFLLLALGLVGMFVLGRPRRKKRWSNDVGRGGDGGWQGGSGSDFSGDSGGHSDGGGHGGH